MKKYTKNRESQSRTVESNSNGFRQPPISEILQAYRNGTLGRSPIQRESIEEDDDLIQTKTSGQPPVSAILQQYGEKRQKYASEEDEEIVQGKFDTAQRQEKSNNTGLPDNLKSGIENLSGYSMDDVKVHYNSDKPAQLNALAYTQGTNIHVAPGQEKYLPHEAWHVVQQKQGRVQPTVQMQGVNVNDNEGLEKEADVMGEAINFQSYSNELIETSPNNDIIQRLWSGDDFKTRIETIYSQTINWKQKMLELLFQKQLYVDNPEFLHIYRMLQEYENFNMDNEEERQNSTIMLDAIQQMAFKWYQNHKRQETIRGREGGLYDEIIKELLDEIRDERVELTTNIVNNHDRISFCGQEYLEEPEQEQMQNLWNSIVNNHEHLITQGNGDFLMKMYSEYLALMQSPSGRALLLNAVNAPRNITVDEIGGEPAAAPQIEAAELPQAGVLYESIIHARDLSNNDSLALSDLNWTDEGETGDLELMPSFLILGHEIAHAIRYARGIHTGFQERHDHWHNEEEFEVITNSENILRNDYNLGRRRYHRALPW